MRAYSRAPPTAQRRLNHDPVFLLYESPGLIDWMFVQGCKDR